MTPEGAKTFVNQEGDERYNSIHPLKYYMQIYPKLKIKPLEVQQGLFLFFFSSYLLNHFLYRGRGRSFYSKWVVAPSPKR